MAEEEGFVSPEGSVGRRSGRPQEGRSILRRSNPISDYKKKIFKRRPSFYGGEGGIRTLERLLTVTRFPIVRARPATRLLRISAQPVYYIQRDCKSQGFSRAKSRFRSTSPFIPLTLPWASYCQHHTSKSLTGTSSRSASQSRVFPRRERSGESSGASRLM